MDRWRAPGIRSNGCSQTRSIGPSRSYGTVCALFKTAIQRRLPTSGDFAVPLSGGRDSRHLLLELCEAGARPSVCLTYRHTYPCSNRDILAAAELSKALNLPHVIVPQPSSRFKGELRKNVKTNFCSDKHTQFLALADYVHGRFKILYDGIGGDVLSNGLFLDEARLRLFERGDFLALAENLLSDFPNHSGFDHERLLVQLLRHDQYRRFSRDAAVDSLATELSKHAQAPNPIASFFFWNRTRRDIALAPFRILGEVAQIFCPYLDYDLYDFLASLPASLLLHHTFHRDTIRKAYPDFASITFDNEVRAWKEVPKPSYYSKFGWELTSYAIAQWQSGYVRYLYLLPRLLKCIMDPQYGET